MYYQCMSMYNNSNNNNNVDSLTLELIKLTERYSRVDGSAVSLSDGKVAQRSGNGASNTDCGTEPIGTGVGVAHTSSSSRSATSCSVQITLITELTES